MKRLKQKLHYEERKANEGYFGSSTPSSKIPIKADSKAEKEKKPRGGRPGHKGHGRPSLHDLEADRVEDLTWQIGDECPLCGGPLEEKEVVERLVLESRPRKAERVVYLLVKKHCPNCRKTFRSTAPVLPKALHGNQLCANAAVMHYLHGIPIGRITEELGIGPGSLVEIFHRLARLFDDVPAKLIDDCEKEFPDSKEVKAFVSTVAPLLSLAMGLRNQAISDRSFKIRAAELKAKIKRATEGDARHQAIRRIQGIFRENEARLYYWAEDRRVPADNNLSERDLRPTVIARKVSFGSQSDAGAETRGVLMTVLYTLKKCGFDVAARLKHVLDELAKDINQDPFPLLFDEQPPGN